MKPVTMLTIMQRSIVQDLEALALQAKDIYVASYTPTDKLVVSEPVVTGDFAISIAVATSAGEDVPVNHILVNITIHGLDSPIYGYYYFFDDGRIETMHPELGAGVGVAYCRQIKEAIAATSLVVATTIPNAMVFSG